MMFSECTRDFQFVYASLSRLASTLERASWAWREGWMQFGGSFAK